MAKRKSSRRRSPGSRGSTGVTSTRVIPAKTEPAFVHLSPELPPIILRTLPGKEKYSAVLLRFAEPLLAEVSDNYEDFYLTIATAVLLWNLANLPADQQDALLQPMLKSVPFFRRRRVTQELAQMLARKKELFADYDWFIQAFRLIEKPDEFRVEVMVAVDRIPDEYFQLGVQQFIVPGRYIE